MPRPGGAREPDDIYQPELPEAIIGMLFIRSAVLGLGDAPVLGVSAPNGSFGTFATAGPERGTAALGADKTFGRSAKRENPAGMILRPWLEGLRLWRGNTPEWERILAKSATGFYLRVRRGPPGFF